MIINLNIVLVVKCQVDALSQHRDPVISNIASDLENSESQLYALINGRNIYWFPHLKQNFKSYVDTCISCLYYFIAGKKEGTLHNIPKAKHSVSCFTSIIMVHYRLHVGKCIFSR